MSKNRTNLVRKIRFLFISFMVCSVSAILILQVYQYKINVIESTDKMRKDYLEQQKLLIKNEVNRVIDYIYYQQSLSDEKTKEIVKNQVYEAYSIVENLYKKYKHKIKEKDLKKLIVEALRAIRYENEMGYFFITNLNGVEILFADKPEMEGRNLINIKDLDGHFVIKDMIKIVKENNEGFYSYYWTKPNSIGKSHLKISFIKKFTPYNWIIGTGLYVNDIENNIKFRIVDEISKIRFGKEGYIFVNKINGDVLVSNGKTFKDNKKLWELYENKSQLKKIFNLELEGVKNKKGDFIEYNFGKLSDFKNKSKKLSFVRLVDNWDWIIGAGIYMEDIELEILKLEQVLKTKLFNQIIVTLLVTLLIFIFFMILFDITSKYILNDFNLFISFFKKAAIEGESINLDNLKYEELYTIAESANKMLNEKSVAKAELLKEKEQLSESRLKYKTLFESAGDALFLMKDGIFIDCNSKTLEMFKTKKEDIINKSPLSFSPKIQPDGRESNEKALELINKAMKGEYQHFEWKHKRGNGELFDAVVSLSFVDLPKGPHILAIVSDITEKKKVENELLNLRKLDSVGVLAGGIAHDFNNLLTGLYGNLEIAKLNINKEDRAYRFLELAETSMENAKNLTKQLLTFSKGGDPIKEKISIVQVIKETAEFSLRGCKSKIEFLFDENIYLIEADKGQMSQVISNLVINANQAMESGGIITIKAQNYIFENKPFVKILIKDQGHGIKESDLDKIFDPYFSTKVDGNGLGLATTYSIINKHNGKINVNSEINKGTEFVILLPAILEKDDYKLNEKFEDKSISTKGQVKTILVLEDEEIVREVIKEMLEILNIEVENAVEGREAVAKYKERYEMGKPFDLVITDLTIPGGMGGLDATKEILKINEKAIVIVSSGYATNPVMANYAQYGFINRIAKPYRFKELQKVINDSFIN